MGGSMEQFDLLFINSKPILKYDLQFFAKEGPGGEKTEPATPKKLKDARMDGSVAKSKELCNVAVLFALFISLKMFVGSLGMQFIQNFSIIYKPQII